MKKVAYMTVLGLCTMALLAGCDEKKGTVQLTKDSSVSETSTILDDKQSETKEPKADMKSVDVQKDGNIQDFSYVLFEKGMEETNPVLSPVSAYLALALTGEGARGETLQEFEQVFGKDMSSVSGEIMNGLPSDKKWMKIALANSAWADTRMNVDVDWVDIAKTIYQAEVYQTSLPTTDAMNDMNNWIDDKTEGLIPKLLEEPLDDDTRLALFNTIYFKGEWKHKFDASDTYERDFYLEDGTTKKTEMMHQYGEYMQYVQNDEAEGVVLPYADDTKVFLVLKPKENLNVREMYQTLSAEDISNFLQQEETIKCNLRLPKFEVEFAKNLNDTLKSMGINKAFDKKMADLSGLGNAENTLYISLVYQKAVVIVDEEGTEAAAVTMVEVTCDSEVMEEEPPKDIFFDEPFVYMIMDKEREIPLFVGIMDSPQS